MPDHRDDTPNETDQTPMATTAEVAAVVNDVQRRHRGKIRWSLGRHTAELALRALDGPAHTARRRPSSKSRRRKRHKRLL
jgi:hypothetical protein